jgi:hypothetical protein
MLLKQENMSWRVICRKQFLISVEVLSTSASPPKSLSRQDISPKVASTRKDLLSTDRFKAVPTRVPLELYDRFAIAKPRLEHRRRDENGPAKQIRESTRD